MRSFVERPFRETTEEKFGIKTPKDRVKEFRKLAKGAAKQSPEEQEQTVVRLAHEYQQERDGWVRREILRRWRSIHSRGPEPC